MVLGHTRGLKYTNHRKKLDDSIAFVFIRAITRVGHDQVFSLYASIPIFQKKIPIRLTIKSFTKIPSKFRSSVRSKITIFAKKPRIFCK